MRRLGKSLLRDAAERLSGRQGQRESRKAGPAGERSGATRAWAFGDTEPWDVTRTLTNAIVREAGEGRTGPGVRLTIDDVEVQETEERTQAAVALLVDHGVHAVVSMVAVVRAGGVYVPLNKSFPIDRVRSMIAPLPASLS